MSDDQPPTLAPASYIDRRKGLIGFGVLAIILGCINALFVPLMVFTQLKAAQTHPAGSGAMAAIAPIGLYGGLAVLLLILGIGSVRAKRWARALILCSASLVLVSGVLAFGVMIVLLATFKLPQNSALNDSARLAIKIGMFSTVGILMVLLPALFVWFYRRPGVKLTCEAINPQPSWTDRCPLPVLAACILIAFGAFGLLFAIGFKPIFPIGTFIVEGFPARLLWLLNLLVLLYTIRGYYRLELRAWTVYFAVLVFQSISGTYGYLRGNLAEVYLQSVTPRSPHAPSANFSALFNGHTMAWVLLGVTLPLIAYQLYLRHYFTERGPARPAPSI